MIDLYKDYYKDLYYNDSKLVLRNIICIGKVFHYNDNPKSFYVKHRKNIIP